MPVMVAVRRSRSQEWTFMGADHQEPAAHLYFHPGFYLILTNADGG